MESGGELAANLHQLYDFCQVELYQASVQNDVERLSTVETVMGNIKEGWMNFGQYA
jgi:flagellar protein FliS